MFFHDNKSKKLIPVLCQSPLCGDRNRAHNRKKLSKRKKHDDHDYEHCFAKHDLPDTAVSVIYFRLFLKCW